MYTATGPGSVRKVLRRRASLQLVMEVLSSDGEKILVKYHRVQYLTNPVFSHSSEHVIVVSQQSIFNQSSIVITDRHRLQSPSNSFRTLISQQTCTVLNLLFHWSRLICTSIVFRDRGIVLSQSLFFSPANQKQSFKQERVARFPNIKLCFINDTTVKG